ncbi:hypothetical protein ACBQ21_09000 [Pseudomonas putida]|uniref:hypothetical protein n=1 Tax=Pseudomonas putida TaxID=303 RepID=UPI003525DBBE
MNFDRKKLKAMAESATGVSDVSLAPDVILDLLAERDELIGKATALARDVSIARRQKSQYFRAVKWFLANTNIDPRNVPGPVRHTLVFVVGRLIAKAQRAAGEVANG